MANKKAYFQGGGGVNEPTPGKKKYKSDTAITVQPRFVEPFYRNYDLYDVEGVDGPAKHGPGSGWNHMNEFKSIKDFLDVRRQKLKGKYVAEDTWIEDTAANRKKRVEQTKIRAALISRIVKLAADENDGPNFDYGKGMYSNMDKYKSVKDFEEHADKGPGAFFADDKKKHGPGRLLNRKDLLDVNHIDFPVDDQINSSPIVGNSGSSYMDSIPISYEEGYTPLPDQDGKPESSLDFGYDLSEDAPIGREFSRGKDSPLKDEDHLNKLEEKYVPTPAETEIYGLPDGVEPEAKDADQTIQTENPDYGITDSGRQMYEDKWNI